MIIEALVNSLNRASTVSTAAMDLMGPTLWVVFLTGKGDVLLKLGYYEEDLLLDGVTGRYWDQERDLFYGSRYELP